VARCILPLGEGRWNDDVVDVIRSLDRIADVNIASFTGRVGEEGTGSPERKNEK